LKNEIEAYLDDLNNAIRRCDRCRLYQTRIHAVCGEGNCYAELMLIAQAPGKNEDLEGRMFIGPSGQVLDDLLRSSRIDREAIYMTNLVKCMLPKYRRPKSDEIEACSPYLDKEIKLVNPELLAPLGHFATRYILGKFMSTLPPKAEFKQVYGKVFNANGKRIIPLQHPAAILYDHRIENVLMNNYRKLGGILADLM
jgi:DNA polymerase